MLTHVCFGQLSRTAVVFTGDLGRESTSERLYQLAKESSGTFRCLTVNPCIAKPSQVLILHGTEDKVSRDHFAQKYS